MKFENFEIIHKHAQFPVCGAASPLMYGVFYIHCNIWY